ncbi:MAG: DUF2007 domain-containing protein [Ignavibacteria bacterium]|nr:DUF2007 domain-containing protein [Ignavibacteria bacterium]MBI3766316.1 DUF2007 domain-containing protein [Ignavibacteriales bacterium]
MEKFISIATYTNEVEAELAQATLAAAGIESYLKYEDTGGMMPVLQQSEGIKLLVDEEDVIEAKAVLTDQAKIEPDL